MRPRTPQDPMSAEAAARRRGFTLIELLVVMAIIAILAGILLPVITAARRQAKIAATRTLLAQIGTALGHFNDDWGRYPPDNNGDPSKLPALVAPPTANASERLYFYLATTIPSPTSGKFPYIELQPGVQNAVGPSGTYYVIVDAWQLPFYYKSTSPVYNPDSFDLWSGGPNRLNESGSTGTDDITNW